MPLSDRPGEDIDNLKRRGQEQGGCPRGKEEGRISAAPRRCKGNIPVRGGDREHSLGRETPGKGMSGGELEIRCVNLCRRKYEKTKFLSGGREKVCSGQIFRGRGGKTSCRPALSKSQPTQERIRPEGENAVYLVGRNNNIPTMGKEKRKSG